MGCVDASSSGVMTVRSPVNIKELRLALVDALLQEADVHPLPPRPPAAWVRAIRETLGISAAVLAKRL